MKKEKIGRYMNLMTDFGFKYVLAREENNKKVSDILNFIIIELPKFKKEREELKTKLDCWMFSFKNMDKLESQPREIQGEIFDQLFMAADTNKLTTMEQRKYRKSVAEYADVRRMMDYSEERGMPAETVSEITGLPLREVKLLAKSL